MKAKKHFLENHPERGWKEENLMLSDKIWADEAIKMMEQYGKECFEAAREQTQPYPNPFIKYNKYPTFKDFNK